MRTSLLRRHLSGIATTLIITFPLFVGCAAQAPDGGGGNGNDNGTGDRPGGDDGVLMGQVWSVDGTPLPGVAVTLNNGRSASTEDNGVYSFSDLTPGDTIVAKFRRTGYAATAKALEVQPSNAATPACIIMARAADTVTISADADITQRSGDSAVTISSGSLVDGSGKAVTGDVQLTATFLDPSTNAVQAFPGSFDGARSQEGEDTTIESLGFAIYELTQDGEDVNLAAGASADIEYVLPDNSQNRFSVGDTIPLWEFDDQTATWIERGRGVVVEASDGSGRLAWSAAVDHFSAWNADLPINEKNCVTGRVVSDGDPVVGAYIVAVGATYNGTSEARTDTDGIFCVEVKRGSTVTIQVRLNSAAAPVATRTITVGGDPADCNEGICDDTGDIEIELDSCVAGRLTDKNGDPFPIEAVYVSPGVTAATDLDGYYCARAPANTVVFVFAENQPSVSVMTPSSGSCTENVAGCAHADLTLTLPGAGDTVGGLDVSKQVVYTGSSGVPKQIEPLNSFSIAGSFLTFDPEQASSISFAGISVELEEFGQCSVRTMTISTSLGEEAFADFGLGGIGALDPGSPGRADNGLVTVELFPGDPFDTFGQPIPVVAGFFTPQQSEQELLSLGFDAGQTIAFEFPGGADIGPFAATVEIPPDLEVTVPDLADPATTLDLTGPLNLEWVAFDPSDTVMVTLTANDMPAFDLDAETIGSEVCTTLVICEFPDTGAGTIPAEVTARLPANASFMGLSVARTRGGDVNVPLKRVDGDGVVMITGSAGVFRAFTSFNIPDIDDLLPDGLDPDTLDPCALLGIVCAEGEVCNTDSFPFTCVPAGD